MTGSDAEEYTVDRQRLYDTAGVKNQMSAETNKLLTQINDRLEAILVFVALIFALVVLRILHVI